MTREQKAHKERKLFTLHN